MYLNLLSLHTILVPRYIYLALSSSLEWSRAWPWALDSSYARQDMIWVSQQFLRTPTVPCISTWKELISETMCLYVAYIYEASLSPSLVTAWQLWSTGAGCPTWGMVISSSLEVFKNKMVWMFGWVSLVGLGSLRSLLKILSQCGIQQYKVTSDEGG